MATRFYFVQWGITPPEQSTIFPAFDAAWELIGAAGNNHLRLKTYRESPAAQNSVFNTNGVSGTDMSFQQWITDPLRKQTISGTVKGMIAVAETNLTDNYFAAMVIRVLSENGTVVRGTLLSSFGGGTEFPTTVSSIKFPPAWSAPGASLTPVNILDGDRIVVEPGLRQTSTSTAIATIESGSDKTKADYNETEGGTGGVPWIEFSQTLIPYIPNPPVTPSRWQGA